VCVCACGGVARGNWNSATLETHAGRVVDGCCARYAGVEVEVEVEVEVGGNGDGNRYGYEGRKKDE
jgi:hypothetical protein